jgi:hypothetical protein
MVQEEMGEIKEDQRNGDTFRSVGAVKWLVYRISYSMSGYRVYSPFS